MRGGEPKESEKRGQTGRTNERTQLRVARRRCRQQRHQISGVVGRSGALLELGAQLEQLLG